MPARAIRHKNLTRFDHPRKNTFGYFVRIQWKGEKHTKFFSDSVCGDRLSALAAALEWRDTTEQRIGKPRTNRQVVGFSSRNKSGVVGVRRLIKQGRDVYEAHWMNEAGKIRRTSYSIALHGEKRAFRKAVRARQLHEQMRLRTPFERDRPPSGRIVRRKPAEQARAVGESFSFDPFHPFT